ncbi:MAG: hypothetical protein AB1938_22400 [Myxococcota bacterium]
MRRLLLGMVCGVLVACGGGGASADGGSGGGSGGSGGGTGDACPQPSCITRIESGDAHALAFDGQGRAIAAWGGGPDFSTFGVSRLEGGQWRQLGGTFEGVTYLIAGTPRVAVDAMDRPIFAWPSKLPAGTTGVSRIRVERWNGAAWELLGNELDATNLAGLAAIGSTLYVVASVQGVQNLFTLTDGAANWTPSPVNAGPNYYPYPVLGKVAGVPHLALKSSMDEAIHAYSAASGLTRRGPDLPALMRTRLRALLDLGGDVVIHTVSSATDGGTAEVSSVDRLSGAAWVHTPGPELPRAKEAGMTVVNGSLVTAFFVRGATILEDDTLKVLKWTGSSWTEIDSYTSSEDTALPGTPIVAVHGSTLGITWETPAGSPGFRIAYRSVNVP